jgi:hypothetical protein
VSGYRLASSLLLCAFIITFLRLVPTRHLLLRVSEFCMPGLVLVDTHFTQFLLSLLLAWLLAPSSLLYSTTLLGVSFHTHHPLRFPKFATTSRPHFTSLAHLHLSSLQQSNLPFTLSGFFEIFSSSRRRRYRPLPPLPYRHSVLPFGFSLAAASLPLFVTAVRDLLELRPHLHQHPPLC